MHDDDFRKYLKNNYAKKRPLNLYFVAFCGVIYQNLLHSWGLYCSKQLETREENSSVFSLIQMR